MADSIVQISKSSHDDNGLQIETNIINSDEDHSSSEISVSTNILMCNNDSTNTITTIHHDQNAITESIVPSEGFSETSLNNDRLLIEKNSPNSGDNHALSEVSNLNSNLSITNLAVNTSTTDHEQDSASECKINSGVLSDASHHDDGLLLKTTRTSHNHDGLLIETISLSSDDNHTLSEISNLNSNLSKNNLAENTSTTHHEQDSDTIQDEVSYIASNDIELQISTNTINSDNNHTRHEISNLNSNLLSNNKTESILTPNLKQDLVKKSKVNVSQSLFEESTIIGETENYDIGDIVWAKIGKYPFWPSVVCFDPKSNIYFKGSKNLKNFSLHVRFCNDKGRRSWTKTFVNYNGKNELLSKYPSCLSCIKSSKKLLDTWNLAVEEADHLLKLVGELRMLEFFKTFLNSDDLASLNPTALNMSGSSVAATKHVRTYSRKRSLTIPEQDSYTKIIKTENHLCMNGNSSSRSIDIPFPSRSDDADSTVSDISMSHVYMEDLGMKMKRSIIDKRRSTKKYPPKTSFTDKYDLSDSMVFNNDRSLLLDNHDNYSSTATNASTSRTIPKQRKLEIRNLENFEKDISHSRSSKKNLTTKSSKSDKDISSNNDDLSSNSTSHSQSASSSQKMVAKLKPQRKESFTGRKTTTKTTIKSESSPEPDTTESEASSKNDTYTSVFSTSRKNKQLFVKSLKRACVVCKNVEETVKCMGPCQSYFHKECLAKSEERYFKSEPKNKKVKKASGRSKRCNSKSTHKNVDASASVPQIVNNVKEENTGKLYENGENLESTNIKSEFNEECLNETNEENDSHDQPKSDDEKVNTQELNELESVVRDSIQKMENKHFDSAIETSLNSSVVPENDSKYMCSLCKVGKAKCFVCTLDIEDPGQKIVCKLSTCGKNYHEYCLAEWPQCQWIQRSRNNVRCVVCPHHVCHLCISDNPKSSCKMHFPAEKLTRCIKCPTAYHRSEYCIPAGSQILTYLDIICSRHFEPSKERNYHFNATWCFICTLGGELVCCDLCPSSFHIKCLNQNPSEFDRGFTCEECQTGRYPLYGEIVWVKLGNYRWWPAQIVFPGQIPESINSIAHSVGEFAVRFFGSYDYYWVNRGRVFNFHEGDDENILTKNNKMKVIDQIFQDAIIEAAQAHNAYIIDKDKNDAIVAKKYLAKPPKFTRIKFNKPYGNVKNMEFDITTINPCECDPFKPNPCGPGSDCINRMLMFECHPQVCPAEDKCNNQRFEKTLYPPMVPFLTQGRGWGLKTLEDIKEGSFVIEYVGEVIDEEEFQSRCLEMHQRNEQNYYFLTIDNSRMIDAGPKGNLSRFMNHSCEPNCVTQKWTVNGDTRIGLFALYDIPAGTELVFDYRLQSCSGVEKKPCQCGATRCSKFIGVKVEEEKKKVIPLNDSDKIKTTTKNKRKPLKHKDNVSDLDKSKISKVTNDDQNVSITENAIDTYNAEKNDDSKKSKNKVSTGKPSTVLKNENLETSETPSKTKRRKSTKNNTSITKDDDTTVNCLESEETKSKKKIKNSSSTLPSRKQSIKNNVIKTDALSLPNDSTGIPVAKSSKNRDHVVDLENMITTNNSRKSTRGLTKTKQIPEVLESVSEINTDKSTGYQESSSARNSLSRLAKTRHSFLSKMNKNDTGKKKIEQPQPVVSKKKCNTEKMNTTKTKSKRTEIPLVKTVGSKKNKSSTQPKQTNKRQKLNQNLLSKSYKKNESCLICGKGYAELICKNKKCPRVFHLSCMNRTRIVKSGFICPSHFCSICKKRKVVAKCKFCVESFCTTHVKGNIFKDPLGHGMLCTTHHPNKKSIPVPSTSSTPSLNIAIKENATITKIADPVNFGGSSLGVELPETLPDINEELGLDIDDINEEEYTLTQVIKDDSDREYIHIGGFNVCNMSDLVTDQTESYVAPVDTDGDLFKPSSANVVIDIESASALYQPTDSLQLVSIATENKESHDYANVNFIPDSNQTKNKWLAAEP